VISRSAYGAFMLQGVVLIGLAIALRPLSLPAKVKALIVAAGGVADPSPSPGFSSAESLG
jgi:glucans biosynthesis protein C